MNKIDKIIDKAPDIMMICIGISMIIFVTIMSINLAKDYEEENCVKFYNENNYILGSCEIYKEKLEKSKE